MDTQMPVMDGFEAAGKIREGEKNCARARTPIIAMTAFAEEKFKNDDRIDDVLVKPVSLHSLRNALEKWRF
jgi:CheY-like chemotaxis protein